MDGSGEMPGRPRRILLHGVTGSGKTTLARRIESVLGLPCHSVDDEVGWLPGWVERPRDEQGALISQIVSAEEWVLDTAYAHWRDVVLERTELIVALDYPRHVSLMRLIGRTARRVVTGEEVCNGSRESLPRVLSSQSIVAWHFRSFGGKRDQIVRWLADPAAPPIVRLGTQREADAWLASLGKQDS